MNTISYKDLKNWYIENNEAKALAKQVFGDKQPSIYRTGFYSAPSWNWGYIIGIVKVERTEANKIFEDKYFEVVTQSGEVKAAREIFIPTLQEKN